MAKQPVAHFPWRRLSIDPEIRDRLAGTWLPEAGLSINGVCSGVLSLASMIVVLQHIVCRFCMFLDSLGLMLIWMASLFGLQATYEEISVHVFLMFVNQLRVPSYIDRTRVVHL